MNSAKIGKFYELKGLREVPRFAQDDKRGYPHLLSKRKVRLLLFYNITVPCGRR
jgi:hypothetical protein